jgi:hypothetical protein
VYVRAYCGLADYTLQDDENGEVGVYIGCTQFALEGVKEPNDGVCHKYNWNERDCQSQAEQLSGGGPGTLGIRDGCHVWT